MTERIPEVLMPDILLFDEAAQDALIQAASDLAYRSNRDRLLYTVMDLMQSGSGKMAAEYLRKNGFRDESGLKAIRDFKVTNMCGAVLS